MSRRPAGDQPGNDLSARIGACGRARPGPAARLERLHHAGLSGRNIAAAFDDLYYLERACMLQVLGMGTGRPLRTVPDAIAVKTGRQIVEETAQAELHFEALKRLLDRDESGGRG